MCISAGGKETKHQMSQYLISNDNGQTFGRLLKLAANGTIGTGG
jgi:hypothetical protein